MHSHDLEADEATSVERRKLSFRFVFLVSWLPLFVLGLLWGIANPLGNAPDEPAQIARAVAIVHGEWVGIPIDGEVPAYTEVRIPRTYALGLDGGDGIDSHNCYHFMPTVSASCEHFVQSGRSVDTETYLGHYPPLYFGIVGIPSLITSKSLGIYLMRAVSIAMGTLLLAIAFAAAYCWSESRLVLAAVLVVTTPTTVFLVSSVNASGFELAAAISAWTIVFSVQDWRVTPPPGASAAFGVSLSCLALSRPISPVWVFVIVATWCGSRMKRGSILDTLRVRQNSLMLSVVIAASMCDAIWVVKERGLSFLPESPVPAAVPTSRVITGSISHLWNGIAQVAGTFGWNDTSEPQIAVVLLFLAAAVPIVLAIGRSSVRDLALLNVLVVLAFGLPLALVAIAAHKNGFETQGRYFMPLWVGVPICAASTQRNLARPIFNRLSTFMIFASAFGLIVGFWWNLHRTTVGVDGPYLPWQVTGSAWRPPWPATLLLIAEAVVVIAIAIWTGWLGDVASRDSHAQLRPNLENSSSP